MTGNSKEHTVPHYYLSVCLLSFSVSGVSLSQMIYKGPISAATACMQKLFFLFFDL